MSLEFILGRRSIRQYREGEVSDEQLHQILEAAMGAPSAGDERPWHFIVIRDREVLNQIPVFHPYAKMLLHAPVAILVCGDESLEKHKGCWVQDCSAATQNLLLAVHGLGLGAVWVGVYPRKEREEEFRKLLQIPASVIPLALIPIGQPGEQKTPAQRYDEKRVHHDHW